MYGVDAGKERKLLPMHTKLKSTNRIVVINTGLKGLWCPSGIETKVFYLLIGFLLQSKRSVVPRQGLKQ